MASRAPFSPLATLLWVRRRCGKVSPRRLPLWWLYLCRYVALEPVRLLERLLYDRAIDRHVPPAEPVFILGHWRTGTSHLQTLLHLDPSLTTSTIFRSVLPDVHLLMERWLAPGLNWLARMTRARFSIQRMPMDVTTPAEADLALCCRGSRHSYTWGHLFPRSFDMWMRALVHEPSPEAESAWLDDLARLQRKLSLAAGGKRVVLKSPGDTARVAALARRFPKARFIYLHRDPIEVFHSNRYLWQVVLSEHAVQTLEPERVDAMIIEHYVKVVGAYMQQRSQVESRRLIEVRYEDLRDEPIATLERIYAHLGLGEPPAAEVLEFVHGRGRYAPQEYVTTPALRARLQREMVGPAERSCASASA